MGARIRGHRSIGLLVLAIFTFLLVSACSGKVTQNPTAPSLNAQAAECRVVKHTMGETCVPLKPQRIVTLFTPTLSTLLALGVKPIGTTITDSIDPSVYLADKMAGIELLGSAEQPNLEKILLLKPDLMITTSGENTYGKLSQIAPTVAFEWDGTGD